jgi:hypothetical protein
MAETFIYDIFISHAFEDKNSFANELAAELTKTGLKVWYSGYELKLGDSIATSINQALKSSAFGIVVISPVYLRKRWAMNELNTLLAQEAERNRILPILHEITIDEIKAHFPLLADRYTISSEAGMAAIIKKILQTIAASKNYSAPSSGTEPLPNKKNKAATPAKPAVERSSSGNSTLIGLILLIVVALILYFIYTSSGGSGVDKLHVIPSNSD